MERNEVNTAFEILLEEIELVANLLNESGADAFRARDYDKARQAIEEATRLADFREKVKALQREWAGLAAGGLKVRQPKPTRTAKGRLERGLRTPEEAFRRPILEALVELGSKASIGEVLEKVGIKMKGVLNEYDRKSLPSDPRSVRWKNTAQWCRNSLVREGLMKSDSPHGVWEISDQGRRWLEGESKK
ncbi:winged helix-turn-helix domain-containing protein [Chloroflexus sp.]|uniref:winged helix-turn-helix domain-containing protein n=1 Tax=Chloroflexus sp. TaxID=1904827 RepID=UPI002ADDDABE|nr:winged helix-turn-helix domain-containing protein [Chloroflexus sp.]